MYKTLLLVGIGSCVGGVSRFLVSRWVQGMIGYAFPLGTFLVNLLGCFFIGLIYALFEKGNLINPDLRMLLTVGFCGGFTTFSTFINENFQLFKEENFFYLLFYLGVSVLGGFLALYLGHLCVRAL